MKICLLSDVHGAVVYLEQALARVDEEQPDMLLLLGDLMYHGPRNPIPNGYNPKKAAELLNGCGHQIAAVRGNCDSEVDQSLLQFPIMADDAQLFIQGRRLFATHGHLYSSSPMPELAPGSVFVYGHTHVPQAIYDTAKSMYIFNPGSLSLPKQGYERSMGVITEQTMQVRSLDGKVLYECELQ